MVIVSFLLRTTTWPYVLSPLAVAVLGASVPFFCLKDEVTMTQIGYLNCLGSELEVHKGGLSCEAGSRCGSKDAA